MGVDLTKFKMYNEKKRKNIKKRLKIDENKIVIGSFQKDGHGWNKGLKPKLLKGPDIFCKVVKKLHEKYDIHVLLTAPARGYVKNKLDEFQIPYSHFLLNNHLEIIDYYNVLDVYLISSRIEGGPKALLESMATGIPLVTTNVGMVPEMIKHNFNGLVAEIDDIDHLYKNIVKILNDKKLKENLIKNGLKIIQEYNLEKITKRYYTEIYKSLIESKK